MRAEITKADRRDGLPLPLIEGGQPKTTARQMKTTELKRQVFTTSRELGISRALARADIVEIPLGKVTFRKDLYPRIETNPTTVQKYAEDLEVLPPIKVNQHYALIDGWHRWTAHKKAGAEQIAVEVVETTSDQHLLELAIIANAKHGLQLSLNDKQKMARNIYHTTHEREREEKKKHLAKILSVSVRTIQSWLSRIDKDSKAALRNFSLAATDIRILACLPYAGGGRGFGGVTTTDSRQILARFAPKLRFSFWGKTLRFL